MDNDLSAIHNYRERHFAVVYFKHYEWRSQPTYFPLSDGSRYTPDFYDEKADEFIEVVGSRQAYHQGKAKYRLFRKCYPHLTLKILDYRGYPYLTPPKEQAVQIAPDKSGRYYCQKCKHRWMPRLENGKKPLQCPWCKSCRWNKRPKKA